MSHQMNGNSEVRPMTLKRWTSLIGIAGACLGFGCGSTTQGGNNFTAVATGGDMGAGNGTGAGGDTGLFGGNGGSTSAGAGTGAGGVGLPPGTPVCGGQAFKAEPMPVDMYIMFDQSSSMGDPLPGSNTTWWGAAQQAMSSFFNDPQAAAAHLGVGLQYFPLNGVAPASCQADYATPEVEVGVLPGNAAALTGSVQKHQPTTFTPTAPALEGAIKHMKAWGPAHPGRAPVVVLVTDGFPTECDPQQITDIAAIAKTAFETEPKVRTFVVGFNLGPGGQNLKEIASAGGTGAPFLIDGGDIGSQFVQAMLSISSTTLQCEFDLPKPADPTMSLDINMVAVTYTPNATKIEGQVLKLSGLGDCQLNNNEGWYFDQPVTPKKIEICPGTCSKFAAGTVKTASGCKPDPGIIH
jgi:hypothetical protein